MTRFHKSCPQTAAILDLTDPRELRFEPRALTGVSRSGRNQVISDHSSFSCCSICSFNLRLITLCIGNVQLKRSHFCLFMNKSNMLPDGHFMPIRYTSMWFSKNTMLRLSGIYRLHSHHMRRLAFLNKLLNLGTGH